jgi:drug/metabolite transporter (DMT)-like permease
MSQNKPRAAASGLGLVDLGMLFVALIWGSNFPIAKYVLGQMRPLAFNSLRYVGASLLLLTIAWVVYRDLSIARKDIPRLLFAGIVGNGLNQILFISGLALTRAGNSSLIIATSPLFVALMNAALGQERMTRRMWLGILLALGGIVAIITNSGSAFGLDRSTLLGDVITLFGAVTWATYAVSSKPLVGQYPPLKMTALSMATATPVLLLAAIPDLIKQDWSIVTPTAWGAFAISVTLSLVLCYAIYYASIRAVGAARTIIYNNLVTVVAVIMSALLLGERLMPLQFVGGVVILLGIYLTRRV